MALTACSGGASDTVGSDSAGADGSAGTINLYAYAVPKPGFDKLIPAFNATDEGKGVAFQPSYGASGDQSRKVKDGAEADFVNFSVEPDITASSTPAWWTRAGTRTPTTEFPSGRSSPSSCVRATRRTSATGTTCCVPTSRS